MMPPAMPPVPPYRPPLGLAGGHRQSVLPTLFRRVDGVAYRRERIELDDGDFLDLDWHDATAPADGPRRVAVVSHGLEGSSDRAYVRGMARALGARGWDVCAWNFRGCSGEPNRLMRATHSGATEDLAAVVARVLDSGDAFVGLVGFSLGGNLTLRWLGEQGAGVDPRVVGAATFAVPIDLASSAAVMDLPSRAIYMRRFLRTLAAKVESRAGRFEDAPDPTPFHRMRSFREFDTAFTAPVHGFESAEDYWAQASARPLLGEIRVPTLLANAQDDPFLGPACFPHDIASESAWLTLVTPQHGGHVGFIEHGGTYWSERVAGLWLDAAVTGR